MIDSNFFQLIHINAKCATKTVILDKISEKLSTRLNMDREYFRMVLMQREKLGGTTLTMSIAVPHAVIATNCDPVVGITVLDSAAINWLDLEGNAIQKIITFVVPEGIDKNDSRVILLKNLFHGLANDSFLKRISSSHNEEQVLKIIKNQLEES